jgi:hypothetical protein
VLFASISPIFWQLATIDSDVVKATCELYDAQDAAASVRATTPMTPRIRLMKLLHGRTRRRPRVGGLTESYEKKAEQVAFRATRRWKPLTRSDATVTSRLAVVVRRCRIS